MVRPSRLHSYFFVLSLICLAPASFFLFGCGGGSTSTPGSGGGTPPGSSAKEWTWVAGSDTVVNGVPVVYGSQGVASPSNTPGGLSGASWIDKSGNLWVFGGADNGPQNDLWEYSPSSREWTWVSGCNTTSCDQSGKYGTQGIASSINFPGGRGVSVSWVDSGGNFWLFGGQGYDSKGQGYYLNDLWEYAPATRQWTWVSGSNLILGQANYGSLGVTASTNVPGARSNAVSWKDSSGNFWLFGGQGLDANGNMGSFNDLWEFSPSSKEWTWVSGGSAINGKGVYGALGAAASGNVPGARVDAVSWADRSDNLWLFGGLGYDSTGMEIDLNDLWEFNPATKQWTWIGGASAMNPTAGPGLCEPGVYGTRGTAAAANVPGGRNAAAAWIDADGNLWLFGGLGCDGNRTAGSLNDLWEFNTASKTWTWQSGSNSVGAPQGGTGGPSGIYGTKGTAAASNNPGGRSGAISWIDSSGNLWLFGGSGHDSTGAYGQLNDLWSYTP